MQTTSKAKRKGFGPDEFHSCGIPNENPHGREPSRIPNEDYHRNYHRGRDKNMSTEAYTVDFDKANYRAPIPVGFDKEDILSKRESVIKDNILRYLGEYRLGVKFDEFFYRIETDPDGRKYLASHEPGPVRDVFRRTIRSREGKGLSVRREVAECLGFQKLEQELVDESADKLFVWISPPGPRQDGYGLYSFIFIGQVVKDPETNDKKIRVVPYRSLSSIEEHRQNLGLFTSQTDHLKKDTDFLASPVIFSPKDEIKTPEDIIVKMGEGEKFNIDWMGRLKNRVGFLIDEYINLVRRGASNDELIERKHAIENYTISIREGLLEGKSKENSFNSTFDAAYVFDKFGRYAPPAVRGSCGSTLMEYHKQEKWEYHNGSCVLCHAKNTDVGPCNICKECEKKFDE